MKKHIICLYFVLMGCAAMGQQVIGLKGTRITLDSSKWRLTGNNLINKNSGNIGIGTSNPTAQFHTTGTMRLEGLGANTTISRILTADGNGNLSSREFSNLLTAEFAALPTGIVKTTTATGTLSIATASDFPILNQNTTGNAATVTTNANLTGPVQSVGNATSITSNAITNAMLSQTNTQTLKGRSSVGTGNVEDLTPTQATALLNNFSATTKGLVPASGGGTTTFLRADGNFVSPPSGGRQMATITADQVSGSSAGNTLEDINGLSFNVVAGTVYRFYAVIPYNSSALNNGSRWTINAPATTILYYSSRYTLSATSETINYLSAINSPPSSNNGSTLNSNIAILEGVIRPSANGTVQVRFACETPNNTITVKTGATLEYW